MTQRLPALAFLLISWALSGCAATTSARPHEPLPEATSHQEPHASAIDIARHIVRGRTGGLFEVRRFRFHPTAASAIGDLAHWAEAVKAIGFDPLHDVDRAFVAASHASNDTGIALLDFEVDDQIVAEALTRVGGRAGPTVPYPRARIPIKGREQHTVALIQPGIVAVVPASLESSLEALRVPATFPARDDKAAARFFAFDPSSSLGSSPAWPRTLVSAHADLEFTKRGGATIRFFGDSTSPEQAARDATALTTEAHRLLTVNLGLFEMQILDPPVFASRGRRVVMESDLLPSDVDWLLRFNGAL